MTAEINISVVDDEITGFLDELLGRVKNTEPVMRAIAGTLADSVEENLERQADPLTGAKWPALAKSTILQRTRKGTWPGKMLQISQGGLASSFLPQHTNLMAAASSNKPYAAIHHFGGQAGRGNQVTIPARPYVGLTPSHRDEVLSIIQRHLSAAGG